jgi:SAM-dependent methyltransferase
MLARVGHHPLDIIDLGCGGGWEFLTTFGHVTGVDYGAEALADAASVYDRGIRSPVEERWDVDI